MIRLGLRERVVLVLVFFFIIASVSPVLGNGWLKYEITYCFDSIYLAN